MRVRVSSHPLGTSLFHLFFRWMVVRTFGLLSRTRHHYSMTDAFHGEKIIKNAHPLSQL